MDRDIESVLVSLLMVFVGIYLALGSPMLGGLLVLGGFGRMLWRMLFPIPRR